MRAAFITLALLAAPAIGQEALPWSDPSSASIWPEHAGLSDRLDIYVFENQWVELQIVHGFAACGDKGRCPAKFVENGVVVSEFLVCSNSATYALQDRFFRACGEEFYLPPGD